MRQKIRHNQTIRYFVIGVIGRRQNQISIFRRSHLRHQTHKTINYTSPMCNRTANTQCVLHADTSGNSYDFQQLLIHDLATQTENFLKLTNEKSEIIERQHAPIV